MGRITRKQRRKRRRRINRITSFGDDGDYDSGDETPTDDGDKSGDDEDEVTDSEAEDEEKWTLNSLLSNGFTQIHPINWHFLAFLGNIQIDSVKLQNLHDIYGMTYIWKINKSKEIWQYAIWISV